MGAVINHPAIIEGSARTLDHLRATLTNERAHSIQGLEEIILRLKSIDSMDPSIGLSPAIAGYEHVIGILAGIDPAAMPAASTIDELARLVQTLTDAVATACRIAQSKTEAALESSAC